MGFAVRTSAVGIALTAALWVFTPGAADAAQTEAARFVKSLGDEAIVVLSASDASEEQRQIRFRSLLDQGFAVNTIARFVIGRYWRAATPQQREEYLSLFRLFVLDTYAQRLDGYSGETFDVIKSLPIDETDTMVSTEIVRQNGPPIRVDYRVRIGNDGHRIVDVIVEGISLVVTQRAEFASVINREGFDGLLARLRESGRGDTVSN